MKEIQEVEYNGTLVLTTQQIAEAYKTNPDIISKNFKNNEDRYAEGKHYVCLTGEELKQAKANGKIYGLQPNANKFYLWTKKGAFLHAKSLNTDTAWEVYDRLVDDYFDKREDFAIDSKNEKFLMCLQGVKFLADDMKLAESSRMFMYNGAFEEFGLPTSFLPQYTDNGGREQCSATELLNRNGCGMKTTKFNELMIAAGYMELRERTSSKGGIKEYKALTDKGLKYGVNLVSNKNQKECQPYYYTDTFMELYNMVTT